MAGMEHFGTARLLARDWMAADAQAAFAIYGRDEVMRWLGAQPRRPVPSLQAMRERLDRLIDQARKRPEYGLWPLTLRSTGELVGAVLLQPLPGDDGDVEVGWHLNPDHWGRGYATEAGRGAIALAFASRVAGHARIRRFRRARRPIPRGLRGRRQCGLPRMEVHFQLPASHYIHMAVGIFEFFFITVALACAVLRTRGQHTWAAVVYRRLAKAAVVGYPLLGVAYLLNRLGGVMEAVFFVGFTVTVVAQLAERTGVLRGHAHAEVRMPASCCRV
jgi:RimJ/RimL family protein N-acetyltransferase